VCCKDVVLGETIKHTPCIYIYICVQPTSYCLRTFRAAGIAGLNKVKIKVTLEQATKAERGSRGIALLFL
jgi:hypothetical protein